MKTLWSCVLATLLMAFETVLGVAVVAVPVAALRRRQARGLPFSS